MRSLRLAAAFIRIPRLFASLLLFPLIVGLFLVYLQLLVTGLVLRSLHKPVLYSQSGEGGAGNSGSTIGRLILFGDRSPRPPLRVCRWSPRRTGPQGTLVEGPRIVECQPDRLDVALHVADPATFDAAPYVELFEGNIDRLHLCAKCSPDVVIEVNGEEISTHVSSVWGLMLLGLLSSHEKASGQLRDALRTFDDLKSRVGSTYLHLAGFAEPVALAQLSHVTAVILNVAGLIVIALWLALRAHRKVLDYFSQSGALLPLVAATGQATFYGSIWILTLLRVSAFLLGAVPMTLFGFSEVLGEDSVSAVFRLESALTGFWIAALATSLALATLIGSIAELKHRHAILSVLYRYMPLVVSLGGGIVWVVTFVLPDDAAHFIRLVITALPLFGTVPVLVAPIFQPQGAILILHALLTGVLIAWAMRRNARWFAAHLEEI